MPPTDYRPIEALGWVDGYRNALAVFAVPVLFWMRALKSRFTVRKNDPEMFEGHRLDWK